MNLKKLSLYVSLSIFAAIAISGCAAHKSPTMPDPCNLGQCSPTLTSTISPTHTVFQTSTSTVTRTVTVTRTETQIPVPTMTFTATTGATGPGRIVQMDMTVYIASMTITATAVYFYNGTGKIQHIDITSGGIIPSGSGIYTYNPNGLVSRIAQGAKYVDYNYDGSGRLSETIAVDGGATTRDVYSYGGGSYVTRVDEYDQGVFVSYRLVTRDANGFIAREDFYDSAGNSGNSYNIYVRDDVQKTITCTGYLPGNVFMSYVFSYDPTGFLQNMEMKAYFMGTLEATFEMAYVLQNALFDPAGIHGYYYSDKDLYPMVFETYY